jgi:hypothetical protein
MTKMATQALLAALLGAGPAAAPATGKVNFEGQSWEIADAVAYRDDEEVRVAFTSKPYDRAALAKDGVLDSFDVLRHDAPTITLRLKGQGELAGLNYSIPNGGGGSSYNSDMGQALKLTQFGSDRVAGSFLYGEEVQAKFDVAIQGKLERVGQPLPAGGGEAGKALLAHVAAVHSGKIDALIALSKPDRRKLLEAEKASDVADDLKYMAGMTPRNPRVLSGTLSGDTALVDFEGELDGHKVKGTADMVRVEGRWYLESIHTSEH